MKGLGVVFVLIGLASFLLPILGVEISFLTQFEGTRAIIAVILMLIGAGLFFFSAYD